MSNDEVNTMMNGFNTGAMRVAAEPESAQVEVRRMLHTLRKRRFVVLLVTVLMAGLGASIASAAGNRYEAHAQILLQRPSANVQGAERNAADADRALRNEVLYIQSSVVRDAVTAALGREEPIKVAASTGGDLVTLTAQADDPTRAARIANAYANAYLQLRKQRIAAEADTIRTRISDVDRRITEAATSADPASIADRTRLEADRQDLFASLRVVERAIAGLGDTPQLVSPAELPKSSASEPVTRLVATFAVLGLLLGIAAAFVIEFFDRRILDEADLASLTDAQTLSALGGRSSQNAPLNAYQLLRFQLLAHGSDNLRRQVALTPVDKSGAAAVATMALGEECGLAGVDVLLMGASLGSSELALRLGLDDERGLATVLAGHATLDSVVQPVPGSARMSVVFAGAPMPGVSLLSTKQGLALVRSARSTADIVLIETPSIIGASDALDLAASADAVVLVVTHKTSVEVVERAIANLRVSGAHLLATILVPKPPRAPGRGVASPIAISTSAMLHPAQPAMNGSDHGALDHEDTVKANIKNLHAGAPDRFVTTLRDGSGAAYPKGPRDSTDDPSARRARGSKG